MFYINQFDSFKNGYNETEGGHINPMSNPEIAKKVSNKLKGRIFTKEWKNKLSIAAKNKGKLIICIETNECFFSIKQAAIYYGGSASFLSNHLKRRRGCNKFKGLTFILKEDS